MAPKKRQKSATSCSLKDAHFKRLDKVIENQGGLGSMLIVGVSRDHEDDDSNEDEEVELTSEQCSQLRHVVITRNRDKALKLASKFVTGGQIGGNDDSDDSDGSDGCGFMMTNTHSGNVVCQGIPGELKKALKMRSVPERFDALFALTHELHANDFWMHDNERWEPGQELQKSIKALGKAWRDTLKNDDATLGIDAEFTRPGVEALCERLADSFEECEAAADFARDFKWRA